MDFILILCLILVLDHMSKIIRGVAHADLHKAKIIYFNGSSI